MASDDLTKQIARDLSILKSLMAYKISTNYKTLPEKVSTLKRLGLSLSEIAVVCNTTPKSVSVRLAEHRRKKGKSVRNIDSGEIQ